MNHKAFRHRRSLVGIALTTFGCVWLTASAFALDNSGIAEQIAKVRVFPHPIRAVGTETPPALESSQLLSILQSDNRDEQFKQLCVFTHEHPGSPWTPSLKALLGVRCRDTGRLSGAIAYWEQAWQATRQFKSGPGKEVADLTVANWSRLLASLGRREQLTQLLAEAQGRIMEGPTLAELLRQARESLTVMQNQPDTAYRCGAFALAEVAHMLQASSRNVFALRDVPSPSTNGFTMTDLVELSKKYSLDLAPAARRATTEIPVPAVIHWRLHHYAAIVGHDKDFYLVIDPIFGRKQWICKEVIEDEASGSFLIPEKQMTPDWRKLRRDETDQIFGKGQPNYIDDSKDEGCDVTPAGSGAFSTGRCQSCPGMPVWWVTEPYINLWIADEPMSYRPSRGEPFVLRFIYKQLVQTFPGSFLQGRMKV